MKIEKVNDNQIRSTLTKEDIADRNIKLSEAPSFGMPITLYDAKSKGARAYEKLAREILKNNETKNNKEE